MGMPVVLIASEPLNAQIAGHGRILYPGVSRIGPPLAHLVACGNMRIHTVSNAGGPSHAVITIDVRRNHPLVTLFGRPLVHLFGSNDMGMLGVRFAGRPRNPHIVHFAGDPFVSWGWRVGPGEYVSASPNHVRRRNRVSPYQYC